MNIFERKHILKIKMSYRYIEDPYSQGPRWENPCGVRGINYCKSFILWILSWFGNEVQSLSVLDRRKLTSCSIS